MWPKRFSEVEPLQKSSDGRRKVRRGVQNLQLQAREIRIHVFLHRR